MAVFVEIEQVDKVFSMTDGGEYIALKNIDLTINKGEFVSLIGHSGCGKSTLLNIVAGLDMPSGGAVVLAGQKVSQPGPDRMVVFQNYSLLPWLTVRENVALAVDEVYTGKPKAERHKIVEDHIALVNLQDATDKLPDQLSGGMKQRVALARALAIRPQLLLLDEPFGALDALTRGNLQEQLMQICQESGVTCLMVTHDVDEALLLSDRVVMLTNGPASRIGQLIEVPFPRPRQRMKVVNHPAYYSLRSEMIYFLNQQKRIKQLRSRPPVARHGLEKVNPQIGFVPLTACAPLAVAQAKGFFARHGLEEVSLVREGNWRAIADGIDGGWLDAAQMPAGMPLWFSLGGRDERPLPVVTALTTARNGNAITLAKRFLDLDVYSLAGFADYLKRTPDQRHTLGMVHPASMHNLLLRYWLAAGGIDPERDVDLAVLPPAQMVANLRAGNIDGFCIGEPWNIRAAVDGSGFTVATDLEIWLGHPAKVLGVREDWLLRHPNTHLALIKALLEACRYCADPANTEEVRAILCCPAYLGTDANYVQVAEGNPNFCRLEGDHRPDAHLQFFGAGAGLNRPSRTEQLWIMTQLARWGIVPFPRNWVEILERVCRVNAFSTAARELGLDVDYGRSPIRLFDGVPFDADDPIGYLNRLAIRGEVYIAAVAF